MRSPYPHELNRRGDDCAEDCPACRWWEEYQAAQSLAKKPAISVAIQSEVLQHVHL